TMVGVDINTLTMEQYLAFSRENQASGMVKPEIGGNGLIPGMTPTQALTAIQTMADQSQKWHDGTSSRNVSSSNIDGLVAIVGCQICEGPHPDEECPLNEEVKQLEEVKYGEFGRSAPFNKSNGAKFRIGPPGYYTSTDTQPPYGEKRPSLEELMNKHQEESARKSAEMKDSPSSSTGYYQVVSANHETPNIPISSSKLKNLHGVSLLSDSDSKITQNNEDRTTEVLLYKLLPKEQNL
ncbi:hypothetical protein Tco_0388870, partial [Tanacetum coccineum]